MKTPKRIFLEHDKFRFLRLFLQHRAIYFVSGTYSLFVPSRREKYIMFNRPDGSHVCQNWTTSDGELQLLTPSEAARAELKKSFPSLKRTGWQPQHVSLFDWRWPMMFSGPSLGEGVYLDLKGAYHQLYKRLWLDVAFPCGYGTLSLAGVAENLREWKSARNSVIGCISARETLGVKGFQSYHLSTRNQFLAPHLWATIQAILNELAFRAEQLGAIYIATDGYIFPVKSRFEEFEELLIDCGLRYRRVIADYDIKSWGSYKIGPKETEIYKRGLPTVDSGFRSINVYDTRYPLKLLSWWAKAIPTYKTQIWDAGGKNYVSGD